MKEKQRICRDRPGLMAAKTHPTVGVALFTSGGNIFLAG